MVRRQYVYTPCLVLMLALLDFGILRILNAQKWRDPNALHGSSEES